MGASVARFVHFRKSAGISAPMRESCNTTAAHRSKMQPMDYKKEIGKRIRTARLEKGWKLRELAEATDNIVSVSMLNNYEHGARMPKPREAVLLGAALGKRPAYFLGVDDVQTTISTTEEALVRNWRTLPENERMKLFRQIEVQAMRYRDPVQDAQVERHLPVPTRRRTGKSGVSK